MAHVVGKFRHLWDPGHEGDEWRWVRPVNGGLWNDDSQSHPRGASSCLSVQGGFGRPWSCASVFVGTSGGVGWRGCAQTVHTCCIAANVLGQSFWLRYVASVTHQFPGTEHGATPRRSLGRFAVEASSTYSIAELCVCFVREGYLVVPGSGEGTSEFSSCADDMRGTGSDGNTSGRRVCQNPRGCAMSVSRVRKLPPVLVMAILDVVVVHSPKPDLLGNRLSGSRGIGYKPGLGGGLGRYIPRWGRHGRAGGHRDG